MQSLAIHGPTVPARQITPLPAQSRPDTLKINHKQPSPQHTSHIVRDKPSANNKVHSYQETQDFVAKSNLQQTLGISVYV